MKVLVEEAMQSCMLRRGRSLAYTLDAGSPCRKYVCFGARSHRPTVNSQIRQPQYQVRRYTAAQSSPGAPGEIAGMQPELKQAVEEFLEKNKVVLFMKGTKQFPQCGFSNTCVQILNMMKVPYETINILEDESLRQGMKAYSQWPTFPQVYINSEFVGGCDILIEAFQNGELQEMLEVGINS